ncbi:MAG: saccharopine dehydrogenase family protein [Gemmatimonadales bacterium]
MPRYRYVVLGSGRQGTAAAYDLALRGDAREITLADASAERAREAATWIQSRLPREKSDVVITPTTLDGANHGAVLELLRGADAAVSALPYRYNLAVTRLAIEAGCNLCDLGGHPETTSAQLRLSDAALGAGVSVVPDCGQAPGMATSLMALALAMVPAPENLEVWDGGLPLDPAPPLFYRLTFAIQGLTNEYDGPCYNLRGGKVVSLESLSEAQTVDFPPPLGQLEAFCASGTSSTFPWTYQGKLERFTSRIVRYPGHLAAIRTLKALGFFSEIPLAVDGCRVTPRRLTETLLEPLLVGDTPIHDVVIVRVHCTGRANGRSIRAEVDTLIYHDAGTGLTAMQRCTGFDAAIVAAMMARSEVTKGVAVRELSVDPERYVAELSRRGMEVTRNITELSAGPASKPRRPAGRKGRPPRSP